LSDRASDPPADQPTFLGVPCARTPPAYRILPVPFERTTSYGAGTADGPRAFLEASRYVELYDETLAREPYLGGIETLPAVHAEARVLEDALAEIRGAATAAYAGDSFVVAVGGEHSITPPLVDAARRRYGDLGVVQFDAHADLRESYEGSPHSHACAMRRVLDLELPTLQVGIRSLSVEEAELARARSLDILWAHRMLTAGDGGRAMLEAALARLPERLYVTFDVDYLDPSLVPTTGTPEPGGGDWYGTLRLLETVFRTKTVVAMDVVELAPIAGAPAPDFLIAKLVYRCLGLHSRER
jgi:agmatinase